MIIPEKDWIIQKKKAIITIAPMGRVAEDLVKVIGDSVQGLTKLPVDTLTPSPLPDFAYMAQREQYNVMKLLKILAKDYRGESLKVLGVTSADITNPILTHVFGEAYMGGAAAAMSYARLRVGPGNEAIPRDKLLDRAVKVAVHEIGHTFNIPHCHHDRCVMRGSYNVRELDEKLNYLCNYCQMFLADSLERALKDHETAELEKGDPI
jgi:archaemetzincin